MRSRLLTGEQPQLGLILLPIGPQLWQQLSGQNRIAVLAPLALFDPDHHPGRIAFNMFRLEANSFPDSQPCAVDGLEQNPVFEVINAAQEAAYLFH